MGQFSLGFVVLKRAKSLYHGLLHSTNEKRIYCQGESFLPQQACQCRREPERHRHSRHDVQVLHDHCQCAMLGDNGHRSGPLHQSARIRVEGPPADVLPHFLLLHRLPWRRCELNRCGYCRHDAVCADSLQDPWLAKDGTRDPDIAAHCRRPLLCCVRGIPGDGEVQRGHRLCETILARAFRALRS